jgi:hypothetical protein
MTRFCAVAAPGLMLAYGLLRFIDKTDGGIDKGGPAWNVGHVAFFVAVLLFAVLAFGLRRIVRDVTPRRRPVADAAVVATSIGAACFLWVILGDLITTVLNEAPLPEPLEIAGPILFQLGLLTLLGLLVGARRLPVWSPVLVLAGFVAIAVSLDLLPVASVAVGAGLAPLAVGIRARQPR